jgi:hypothetical protein
MLCGCSTADLESEDGLMLTDREVQSSFHISVLYMLNNVKFHNSCVCRKNVCHYRTQILCSVWVMFMVGPVEGIQRGRGDG